MSHLVKDRLDLVTRTKKLKGQVESVERALAEDAACAVVLQRLAAARGAITGLMREVMEDHILNHLPSKSKASEEVASDLIDVIRSYMK